MRIRLVLASALLFSLHAAEAVPFTLQGPGVNTNNFRITTFASGIDFPLGLATLSDGSLLVTISEGNSFWNSTGRLVRFTDTNDDGVADGPGTALYSGLPGSLTAVRVAGDLVFAVGNGSPIYILRTGDSPAAPLTLAGRIIIDYPGEWYHKNSALTVRKTPGQTNSYDLLFQLGSDSNISVTTRTATLTNNNVPGANGTLKGDSLYMITVEDHVTGLAATNLTQVGSGLRNAAGFAFHPATGDLYFQDNGIDSVEDFREPLSADELNFIARTNLGGPVQFFGFPQNYVEYRTGRVVGGAGVQPLIAFQPFPDPATGRESEGANDVVFAPPGFPDGLNTGVFIGFHGEYNAGGTSNAENPLVYADPASGGYFHFIHGQQAGIGHLDGLLATRDSLFIADMVSSGTVGNGPNGGVIYQVKSLVNPPPPELTMRNMGDQVELGWQRGTLQQAKETTGPWRDLEDTFSPHLVKPTQARAFYRTRY